MENCFRQIKRKSPRYNSQAHAYITNVLKSAVLKNVSVKGCCIVCKNQVNIKVNKMYIIHVLPENTTKIGEFELLVEARWIRSNTDSFEVGFWIISSPLGFFQYQQVCQHKGQLKVK